MCFAIGVVVQNGLQKQLWDKKDVNFYQCILDDILSRIRIPFHLLSQSQEFFILWNYIFIMLKLVHAMKVGAFRCGSYY